MRTKQRVFWTLLLAFLVQMSFAQEKTVKGVVSDASGPLPGVTVLVKGTKKGTQTDFDGKYNVKAKPGDVLHFVFMGMKDAYKKVGASSTINVVMEEDAEALGEVVVTGLAGATSKKKLSVTVNSVTSKELEKAPATSASSALQGKVAGVVVNNLGKPGSGSTIVLRGATNFYGSQSPLIVLDGVFVEGGMSDINVDDIASFEIVKGAAASALYGSRAGNGVIAITTKRGKAGKTTATVRFETGLSKVNRFVELNKSHAYELASDWESYKGKYTRFKGLTYPAGYNSVYAATGYPTAPSGALVEKADGYADNPYAVYRDHQKEIFKVGQNKTTYLSLASGSERSKNFFSFEYNDVDGVLRETKGYTRNSLRFNLDYKVFDWLKVSTSNNFITLTNNDVGGGDDLYRIIMRLSPEANITAKNPDGQPYYYTPDPLENEIKNPLYNLYNTDAAEKQHRFLGAYKADFKLYEWLNADVEYSFESNSSRYKDNKKYETLTVTSDPIGFGYSKGSLYMNDYFELSQKLQGTLSFAKQFGELDVKSKLSYLIEDRSYDYKSVQGQDYKFKGLESLDNFDAKNITASSDKETERAQNLFGIVGLIYKDRYIVDALYRRDGSSAFGSHNRWNDYYRISGAYRISQDIDIPGVQVLKLKASMGTAGQRPNFDWQYELTKLKGGVLESNRIKGNPDLKPSLTEEMEFGLDASFLDMFDFGIAYSKQKSSDQFMLVNLFSPANGGKNKQWQNAGNLDASTIEASLDARLINKEDLRWNVGFNFTKTEATISKLNAAEQKVGAQSLFLLREGVKFGSMYGRKFVKDLATMEKQLPAGQSIDKYIVNSDGLVVEKDKVGTKDEKAIIQTNEKGVAVFEEIGNQTPDFILGARSSLSYKNFDFYMLWDWKKGGDVYNKNAQYITISGRNKIVDQAGKPQDQKKTMNYYSSLYDTNENNDFWVEDASYVKLRELSLSYTLPEEYLGKSKFFKSVRLSLIGRNLLTFTNYSGWDPEVKVYDDTTQQYYSVDYGGYPNQSSYSMSVQVKF